MWADLLTPGTPKTPTTATRSKKGTDECYRNNNHNHNPPPPPPPHWLHFSLSPSLLLSSLHPVAFLPLLLLLLTAGDAPGCSEASRHVYDFPAGRRVEWEADGLSSCNRNMQIGFLSSLKVWQVALNYRKTLTLNWILFFQLTNEFGMLGDAGGCWGMLETFLR